MGLTDIFNTGTGGATGDQDNGLGNLLALIGGGVAGAIPKNSSQTSSTAGFNDSTTTGTQNLQQLLQSLIQGTQSGQTNQNTQNNQQTSGSTSSGYGDSATSDLSKKLAGIFSSLSTPDMGAIRGAGIQQINQGSQLSSQAQQEALAARGLSTSPVAGAIAAGNEGDRFSKITSFSQSLPLLQNQLQLGNLSAANSFLAGAPKTTTQIGSTIGGQQSSGTTSENTSQNTTQNGTSSGSNSNVQSGQTGQNSTTNNTAGGGGLGAIGGIASLLATIFG